MKSKAFKDFSLILVGSVITLGSIFYVKPMHEKNLPEIMVQHREAEQRLNEYHITVESLKESQIPVDPKLVKIIEDQKKLIAAQDSDPKLDEALATHTLIRRFCYVVASMGIVLIYWVILKRS